MISGIPTVVFYLLRGKTGDIRFTVGGFLILTLLAPLQGVAEELTYRGYLMQTVSSWFRLPAAGILVQLLLFTAVHPYNIIGVVNIAVAALMYALVCLYSKGLEAGSALHMIGNMSTFYMAGFGFGTISSKQTVPEIILAISIKIVFFLFILFAGKKLHWFDKVKYDDVERFNSKEKGKKKPYGKEAV